MRQYLDLLQRILTEGTVKSNRNGDTVSIFGHQMRFDLRQGFPLLTTKKVHLKSIIYELLWFIQGSTNIKYLNNNGVTIWDEWADANGELGPVYGKQWRSWLTRDGKAIDQLKIAIDTLKQNPNSRRNIVSAWNPEDANKVKLPPCHCFFQFYVAHNTLSCMMYQQSCDTFLGVPFNIASYALLIMMIAQVTGMIAGEFIHTLGDTHIYMNHLDQVRLQLTRFARPLPKIIINPNIKNIDDFKYEDFQLINYDPYPTIKAEVAV